MEVAIQETRYAWLHRFRDWRTGFILFNFDIFDSLTQHVKIPTMDL